MQGTPESCPVVALREYWQVKLSYSREEMHSMKRSFQMVAVLLVVGLVLLGCASPEQRAQKLYDQGKYEEVVAKYADQPIAKQAHVKIAEKLIQEGKYEDVLANYADTPSKTEAENKIAEKLYNDKKYDDVLAKYPNTPAANMSRNALADALYADWDKSKDDKKRDDLVAKYPNTTAGMKARNEMAKADFDKAMKNKAKKAKMTALEAIVKNPKYAGTEFSMKAQDEWNKLGGGKPAATNTAKAAPAKPAAPAKKK
jgi:hypothetical protein